MNVYITKLNGLPMHDISQYIQRMTAEIGHQLGFREMGIYRYNRAGESWESLSGRLDGIIAGIDMGKDVVICQFPTGNGIKYEWELIKRLRMYQSRIVIFIHEPETFYRKINQIMLNEAIRLYNHAEVLIVPSLAAQRFLLDNGIKKDMKFVIQEMWDCITNSNFYSSPQFRREIHFTGGSSFEGMLGWKGTLPLKVYTASECQGRNIQNMGKMYSEELLFSLSKGGFGLEWYQEEESHQYAGYGISFSLAQYLAAGIPVIVPAGISSQTLIEKNNLGLIVNSLDEAVTAIETMSEPEYQKYVSCVDQFAPALRNGYYTKKCLVDAVQAVYRKDAGEITIPATTYKLGRQLFTYTVLRESYGGNLALSWNYSGEANGFQIYGISGELIYETRNLHEHYFLIRGYEGENEFIIKAFIDTLKGKLIIAESERIYLQKGQYEYADVSLIIPAYNAKDHIVRGIDNALAQSFPNLEIILVNDGSTDDTADVIRWYAERYPNIIAIDQDNGGAGMARNTGVRHARGQYIGFMDSDDMIRPDMIKRLYYSAKKNNCDIAITSAYWVNDSGYNAIVQYAMKEDTAVTFDEFFDRHYIREWELGVVIWNKLYEASLVKDHLFPLIKGEDEAWTPYILSYANRICYLDDRSYEYDRTNCNNTLSIRVKNREREEVFKSYREAVMFYLDNSNQGRRYLLKELAKERLLEREKAYAYEMYGKLWMEIDNTF